MIKTTPMLFNSELVLALLAGNKTQTRRIVKHQPFVSDVFPSLVFPKNKNELQEGAGLFYPNAKSSILAMCPFGGIGDLIYVRETFRLFNSADECGCADFPCPCPSDNTPIYRANFNDHEAVWKPSIHMLRWTSRLTLKITDVRVERIQDISEQDAKAEGLKHHDLYNEWGGLERHPDSRGKVPQWRWYEKPQNAFKHLWNSVYPESWNKNEWVWVMDFEVIHKNVDLVLAEMEQAA